MTRDTVVQFLKFSLIGIVNTVVSLVCYYAFVLIDEGLYLVGSIVGTALSIASAYLGNEFFVFCVKGVAIKERLVRLIMTYMSYGLSSVMSTILLWILVSWLDVNAFIAPLIVIGITVCFNFCVNKFFIFKAKAK